MKKLVSRLLYTDCKHPEILECIKRGRILEILVKALEYAAIRNSTPAQILNQQDVEKIYAAKDWLTQQIDKPVTLYVLARKVGLNVHKLSIGFHQITGTTIFHFHRKVRMAFAARLLEETDRDLFDIGTEVGYSDGKTFSKEFKKAKGIPPLEYRRQYRLQQC